MFKGEAGTFTVDVEDIVQPIVHGQRHAGADPWAIVGVDGDITQRDIGVVGIVLNTGTGTISADHHALRGQSASAFGQANAVSGAIGGNAVASHTVNQQACPLGQQNASGAIINLNFAQLINLRAGA